MFMQASTAGFAKEDDSAVIKIFPGITCPKARRKRHDTRTCPAGLHCRRLHRRHRPGQQPGARRHARGAGHRRAHGPAGYRVPTPWWSRSSRAPSPKDEPSPSRWPRCSGCKAQGAEQIYFKYCSTFDSTAQGNIGPVTEALMQALGTDFTIATPAFPDNGRTVFKGHLFVGDVLLNESGMQNHPLTPMTDPNLVRVLQAQTRRRWA
jgi:hypothetical protein